MTSNVPKPSFTDIGFVPPTDEAILTGVEEDWQSAFNNQLNPDLRTPQGQIWSAETATLSDTYGQECLLFNSVDPAFASGRMQDAIGRFYFIDRIPASSSVVIATCTGAENTPIPIGSQAVDQSGVIWLCNDGGTIPVGGSIDLSFTCINTGPIACPGATAPNGFLNQIFKAIPGWDSINNSASAVEGTNVESRAQFEFRRQQTVANNARGTLPSVVGEVFLVDDVLDVYGTQNVTGVTSGAAFTGSIAGTVLTVTAAPDGLIATDTDGNFQQQTVRGAGIAQGTLITSYGGGSGGTGTYNVNISQSVSSEAMTSAVGGVRLLPHSIYIAVVGGDGQDVADAIWRKNSVGCNYNGNTSETVTDSDGYAQPYPTYTVKFEEPTPTAIKFTVSLVNNSGVPSNATAQIQAAILAAFTGSDGSARARIGSYLFASRYYAPVSLLGSWVEINSILIGVGTANKNSVLMQIDQVPTLVSSDITVNIA